MNGDSVNNWRPAPQAKEVVAEAVQHSELKDVTCGGGGYQFVFFLLLAWC